MARYVALLRGINVAGGDRELRERQIVSTSIYPSVTIRNRRTTTELLRRL